jgi:hypothetical protein
MRKTLFFLALIAILTSCSSTPYTLTIDGYTDATAFTGSYYVDGVLIEDFTGALVSGTHFYYDIELEEFDSLLVNVAKASSAGSISVSLWYDGKQVATESSDSGDYSSYDSDNDIYNYTLTLQLYYEPTDDDSTDDDDDDDE